MQSSVFRAFFLLSLVSGCAGESGIKSAEVLDERTGITVGALESPIEFVQTIQGPALTPGKRISFAYLGPVEWDRMGDISYGLWIQLAPGNGQNATFQAAGTLTLTLDDGSVALSPSKGPETGAGPYKPVVAWGPTGYFDLDVRLLKRMAASQKVELGVRFTDESTLTFVPTHPTQTTLAQFVRSRGITDD
jgi:hypothetical protein